MRKAHKTILIALLSVLAPVLASAQTPSGKKATVKSGTATVVSTTDDDASPKLISTTDGNGSAAESRKWPSFDALQKAADANDPAALNELGQMYLDGSPDTPQNTTRALLYLDQAARLGNRTANFRLGKLYADGNQTPKDLGKALAYYTTAARAGDPIAQHNVGAMYASGRGVKRDYVEGLAWLTIAGRQNDDAKQSETKLREFLAKYPKVLADGDTRTEALTKELAAPKTPQPDTNPLTPLGTTGTKPGTMKIDIAPVQIAPTPLPLTPTPIN